ncbi:bacterio-opsin activator domain-containing protein [Natronobiforma cellulositropha]|uniref:bacterio-opsin activator domain-containing protein n=1 Tax=Natronobiforma cellulositropha TaxID=1679076 RepID=UPI0021D59DAA|nr:bacterio-opsin activator domain-containing protein [Natronobiforma cellulositropha]
MTEEPPAHQADGGSVELAETETAETLQILLIEDNPGDARLIEEMLRDTRELAQRIDPRGASSGGTPPTVHRETRLRDGLETLEGDDVDVNVVLLDLNLPDSSGLETVTTVVETVDETPIVVLTGVRDGDSGIQAIQRGAQDYLVKDEVTSSLLTRTIHHAIERNRQERERTRRRKQLETLNRLNRIGQDVTHAVITTSTREELEQAVCDRLVASDAYRFVWIGEVSRGGQEIAPRAVAGAEDGYLEETTITIDDDATGHGPAGRAIHTKAVQVMQDIAGDPAFEPWREQALERGYHSSMAVPIVYEELLYGVMNIYSASPAAFSESEREIFARLGDIIGHAITALERKDALVSDSILQLEFQIDGVADALLEATRATDGSVIIEKLIRKDETLHLYGTATDLPQETFLESVEALEVVEVTDVRVLSAGRDGYDFELVTAETIPLFEEIATYGGRVHSMTFEDGELRLLVEVSRASDTRQLIEHVEAVCAGASYVAQRTIDRTDSSVLDHAVLEGDLTEKQRAALEMAFFAGYFDWPRSSTGEEIAERLGISPATFTQHLRAAEQKFFQSVFKG